MKVRLVYRFPKRALILISFSLLKRELLFKEKQKGAGLTRPLRS